MVVKAVLFDLGGVLFSPPQRFIAETERELGLPRYGHVEPLKLVQPDQS